MDGQTHAALGAATALVVIRPTEPTALIATAAVGAFAGILPDIDTGGKVAPIIHKITAAFICIVCFFVGQAALTGSTVIESIDGSGIAVNLLGLAILIGFSIFGGTQPHRGFTHSVLALLIASFSAYLIFKNLALAFCIGYASHLLTQKMQNHTKQSKVNESTKSKAQESDSFDDDDFNIETKPKTNKKMIYIALWIVGVLVIAAVYFSLNKSEQPQVSDNDVTPATQDVSEEDTSTEFVYDENGNPVYSKCARHGRRDALLGVYRWLC